MVEGFGGGDPAEGFAGSAVELGGDGGEVFGGVDGEVGAFGEVLAQEWSGPRKLDLGIKAYAAVEVWARYSLGLR